MISWSLSSNKYCFPHEGQATCTAWGLFIMLDSRVALFHLADLEADEAAILDFIIKRDEQDSRRKNNPLKRADGGHYIDSTSLGRDQVVTEILRLCAQVMA